MRPSIQAVFFGVFCLALAGCAGGGGANGSNGANGGRVSLPSALGSRWTPPEFATRQLDGERAAVLDACVAAANALGYAVSQFNGASGRVSAERRQGSAFDGARQDTLEVTVTTFAPGVTQVALVLREAVEVAGAGRDPGVLVTTSLVRDRPPYDVFFERLAGALKPVEP